MSDISHVWLGQAVIVRAVYLRHLGSSQIALLIVVARSGRPKVTTVCEHLSHLIVLERHPWLGLAIPGVARDNVASYNHQIRLLLVKDVLNKTLVVGIGFVVFTEVQVC